MSINIFKRFGEWVLRCKNLWAKDEYFRARVRITLFIFCVSAALMMAVGLVVMPIIRERLYAIAAHQVVDQHAAVVAVNQLIWGVRIIRVVIMTVAAYFLASFVLEPVRRANELQRRFIASVSHEFRTPLAVMKAATDIALRNPALTLEQALGVLKSNLEEVERLTRITHFFLMISKVESRSGAFARQHVNLGNVVQHVAEILGALAQEAGVSFVVTLDANAAEVRGDSTAIEEMLLNLARNAIQHTPHGGRVEVTLGRDPRGCWQLTVSDTGVGIADEDLPHIFEPFYRGHRERPHPDRQGIGLGLCIVKEIAYLHNAKIDVVRRQPTGTTFLVQFPKFNAS